MHRMTHSEPRVSVIVCTRNRSQRIGPCLGRVTQSGRRAQVAWELIVVDNGSTDNTRDVLNAWALRTGLDVTITVEPKPGLSAARNRGIQVAGGELLVFVDDDCFVEPDWLAAILAAHETLPRPDMVGGRVDLWDDADARISIRSFDDPADIRDFDALCERLIGCNFSVRAEALHKIGRFDEHLGAGTPAGSAEDFDVFYRLLKAGCRLRYEPSVRVSHAHGRRAPRQVAALRRQYARGRGALYAKHGLMGDRALLRHFYWELRQRSGFRVKRDLALGAFAYIRGRAVGRLAAVGVT